MFLAYPSVEGQQETSKLVTGNLNHQSGTQHIVKVSFPKLLPLINKSRTSTAPES